MHLVGPGSITPAPAGWIDFRTGIVRRVLPTAPRAPILRRALAARGYIARLLLMLAMLAAAAAFATALSPRAFGADPPIEPPIELPIAKIVVAGGAHFAGMPVDFSDASTGEPTSRTWAFGDGETSHYADASHTYADPGSYTVTLTVENAGGTAAATITITILEPWTGGIQLYRAGIYSKQATMRLCVAASTQMIRNIAYEQEDHSLKYQSAYNAYGRAHNGFKTPASDGIDPAGWQAMLRKYVDPKYRIAAAAGYTNAVRAAARAIRLTGRPAGVFVMRGGHVWVISGFTATADPAIDPTFVVTSVSVEGPLFGIRPAIKGYDPVPNVRLTTARFARYLLPYRDPYEPKGWRNRYVVVIP
jgi:PKD repeat protein